MDDTRKRQQKLQQLAHIISHQLRGPLSTMTGIVNLMEHNLLTEQECEELIQKLKLYLEVFENPNHDLVEPIYAEMNRDDGRS